MNSSNPLTLVLDFINGLFGEVGIGWFEQLQILIINLRDTIYPG